MHNALWDRRDPLDFVARFSHWREVWRAPGGGGFSTGTYRVHGVLAGSKQWARGSPQGEVTQIRHTCETVFAILPNSHPYLVATCTL